MTETSSEKTPTVSSEFSADDFIAEISTNPEAATEAHRAAAAKLLKISMDYCETFVPGQLKELEEHINDTNEKIKNGKDPQSKSVLTTSLLALYRAHSELMERGPIVFLANTRPLMRLLTSQHFEVEVEEDSEGTDEDDPIAKAEAEYEDLDGIDLSELHKPYRDDED